MLVRKFLKQKKISLLICGQSKIYKGGEKMIEL